MNTKKRLFEAVMADPIYKDSGVAGFEKRMKNVDHMFVERWIDNVEKMGMAGLTEWKQENLTEAEIEMGALRGQTVGDASGAGSGMQVFLL